MENRDQLNPEPQRPGANTPKPVGLPPTKRDGIQAGSPIRPGAAVPPAARDLPDGDAPDVDEVDDIEADEPQTLRQWFIANSVSLFVVAAMLAFVFYWFRNSLEDVWSIAKAFLGLSFVVFIHELGHFMVAKWCDVHVTTFSIGFGPAVPGCAFRWGETVYKLSLIPIGGYVQMVGQVDGDESSDGSEDDARSYRHKTVWQRMAIISAGVIMNVILAVICFIVVFRGPGKERPAGVVGAIDSSAPAFINGIRTSAKIDQVGSIHDPTFEDLMITVMSSWRDEKIRFVSHLHDRPPQELDIEPRQGKLKRMIGLGFPFQLTLANQRGVTREMTGPFVPGSAAASANPPLPFGGRIVATSDPDDPHRAIKALPDDWRYPNKGHRDYFEFMRRMKLLAAEPVVLRIERDVDEQTTTEDVTIQPMFALSLGVRMQMGQISAIRLGSAAQKELLARDPANNRKGDLIEEVAVTDTDGKAVLRFGLDDKTLDPERLPLQLKQWAQRLADANGGKFPADARVSLKVRRHRAEPGKEFDTQTVKLPWDDDWRFDDVQPLDISAPMAIPELGLAYQIEPVVASVAPGVVAGNPLQEGDVIKNVKYTSIAADGTEHAGSWLFKKELEEGQWARMTPILSQTTYKIVKVELKIERGKESSTVSLVPAIDRQFPLDDRGWVLNLDKHLQRADSLGGAVQMGLHDTHNSMMQVFHNIRGMITGTVSIENLGGPVLIANAAYRIAGYDFWEFVFFLGLISVNLAVVNFLPIPVLDGGHMVFLIYEKLRGRPASETVRVVATYAGLALILSLFVVVTYNDIWRFFF